MITLAQLVEIMPEGKKRIPAFVEPLNAAMAEFGIDTPRRQAAFIAQLGHESGRFLYVRELASGAAYDTGRLAQSLGNTPEADGDGQRYRGRGLIQITGRANYKRCGLALGLDLLAKPELLEQPDLACRSAAWFWSANGLNQLADASDFDRITRKINGGQNGRTDRRALWEVAQRVIV